LLAYFWGPIPWMIEAAALMAFIVGDWGDFTIITSLLLFNALLGFWEEHEASNALDALKSSLALKARALRNGSWQQIDARTLVPVVILVATRLFDMRGHYDRAVLLRLSEIVLILLVASVPVAMPAVLSVTMALGARMLAKRKAIVSRLEAIEELAGVDVLCSDKTGTLTENKLTLGEPQPWAGTDPDTLILMASLAS